jgi:hypothetical protein
MVSVIDKRLPCYLFYMWTDQQGRHILGVLMFCWLQGGR